jgi:DNA primase
MSDGKKRSILRNVLGYCHQAGNELLFACPKCNHHKNKLSVNIERDVFKCWVCEYAGRSVYRLVRRYGSYEQRKEWAQFTQQIDVSTFAEIMFQDDKLIEEEQALDLPKEFVSLANKNLPKTSLYPLNYLESRGIFKQDIIKWKIGYCDDGDFGSRIIVPSFGLAGKANFFIARSYGDDWRKYKNPQASKDIIFNELYLDFDEDMILVEGVFDAIKAGDNAVPILGSTLREHSKLFQKIVENDTPIYIALDPDVDQKTLKIIKLLLEYDIEVHKINILPYNDVGEMSRQQFIKRKEEAIFIKSYDYLINEILNL